MRVTLALAVAAATLAGPSDVRAQAAAGPLRLTVDEAVSRGLSSSHRVAEVEARAQAADAVVAERHAASIPRLDALAGYTRTNHVDQFGILLPNNQLRVIYPDVPDNYRSRLDAQWLVYSGGRAQAAERAATAETVALGHDRDAMLADLRAEITRAFWMLASASDALRVLDRSLAQIEAHLRDARNRLDAGLIPPNEVLSVEAQQARQQMLRIQAGANRDVAEAALARLVGAPPGTPVDPVVPSAELPLTPDRLDDLVAAARANRPDRRALADRIGAAGQRVEVAAAGRRPTVGVGAGVDYARPNPRIFPRAAEWKSSWDASVSVNWPLFDGGKAVAERAEASAGQRAAEARLAEFDSMLALEIRQRLSEATSSRAAAAAADAAIRAATEAHRVVTERFNAGVATSTDVLDAQMAVLQAELDRSQALAALRIADAGLARAAGR